jgi:hypothetical protein
MTRLRWTAYILVTFLFCIRLSGDEPQPAQNTLRFPRHYRKLGLDKQQTQKVQTVQAEYQPRIEKLKREIQALQKEQDVKLEKLLTDAQRAVLKELRDRGSGEFKISAPTRPVRVYLKKPCEFGVQLTHDKGYEGDLKLTYPDLPKGMKILPNPFVFKDGEGTIATLKLTADATVPLGEYHITIQATPEYGEPAEVKVHLLVFRAL